MKYIPILLVIVVLAWAIMTYNKFIKLRNVCEEAFSTMDVYLQKRYDLIPNLVETVKGYTTHEQETLTMITQARNLALNARSHSEKIESEKEVKGLLNNLFAIAENYPELKASSNYVELQTQLQHMEEDIANARKYYNAVVRNFNILCESIPSNLIAKIAHFELQPLYMIDDDQHRNNVKVSF